MSMDETETRRAAERAARASYGKLVAILAARDHDIAAAEDALSDALLSALTVWPQSGVPANPEGWLVTAARNCGKNAVRAGQVRRLAEPEILLRLGHNDEDEAIPDARLRLMFVCAHPAIDTAARAPLMLQTVLGIDAGRIARAFLVEPAAMSQRLVRAKARIHDTRIRFSLPSTGEMADRLGDVLDAIYAAFGQGWESLDVPDAPEALTGEAIWLARLLVSLMPAEPEPKGLLALMLYCAARRKARRNDVGDFVPLQMQDARLWDRDQIVEAEGLLMAAARAGQFGRYQCEAAIQSVHVQRPVTGGVNYDALRTLYDLLVSRTDSIGARIGRAVVMAESGAAALALAELDALDRKRVELHQPFWVARARVLALAGRGGDAASALLKAVELTDDPAVQAYLAAQRHALQGAAND
jgi:RNA polymerase sigma-70 factor (ECF subfamily)